MDSLLLQLMVKELRDQIIGARVAKIHQPTPETLILRLWTGRENLRLLLAVGRQPRLHLTTGSYPNPFTPPRFCQLLRARLSRLEAIEAVPGERIVALDGSGAQGDCRLYAELFGPQGNLVLVDDGGTMVDLLYRSTAGDERVLLPGQPYQLPVPRQRHPLAGELPAPPEGDPAGFQAWLLETIVPMSPVQAAALAWQVGQGSTPQQVLMTFREHWLGETCRPGLAVLHGKEQLVPCPPAELPVRQLPGSLSEYLDARHQELRYQPGEGGLRGELQRILQRERKKLQKRLKQIEQEAAQKESFAQRRHLGELLLANLHLVQKGMSSVRVPDYAAQPPAEVEITLDPRLSPQDNAQALFKRYKKEKRGLDHVERRTAETGEELAWLDELQLALDEAVTPEDLLELAEELKSAGLYREHGNEPASRRRLPSTPSLNRTESPGGFVIVWGRNNRANDHLTTRLAAPHDFWFHVHQLPGCHLVLRRDGPGIEVPELDLRYAAALAAGYSRARQERGVTVICCQVKDVYKVKGAHPGQVNLRRFTTLQVEPTRLDDPAPTR